MVVQHNLTAMNSNRMLGLTTKTQAKATEKLSSGYKINRAADDAAGLAISEKMRKQIRGLTQASTNAQDGISAVQTAEGALTEVHDMLQRMNELPVKAANGTQSKSDRQAIQNEINALVTEVDRVAITTKFNETYVLKGSHDGNVGELKYYTTAKGTINTILADSVVETPTGGKINEGNGVAKLLVTEGKDKALNADSGSAKDVSGVGTIDGDIVNKVANSTTVNYMSVKVNGITYYAVTSTKVKTGQTEGASVSEVVEALNALGKKNSPTKPDVKAYASLDELMFAVKQDNGTDIKTISSYYASLRLSQI